MNKILFLLLALIPSFYGYWDYSCFEGYSIICKLEQQGPFYNYWCMCYPDVFTDNIPFPDYKVEKQCNENNYERPKCIQNNPYSMELHCECFTE